MLWNNWDSHSQFEILNEDIVTFQIHFSALLNGEIEGAFRESEESSPWIS